MNVRITKVLRKLAVQSAIPLALAAGYAWWEYQSTAASSRNLASFVKSTGLAFFLIMWFVGQWFRADKQITDAEQLSDIKTDVAQIKAAVLKESAAPHADQASVQDPVSSALLAEAETALAAGLNQSALLATAAAFDHSLRSFARRHQVAGADRMTGGALLPKLREILGPAITGDLQGLWRARNAIVHVQSEHAVEPIDSRRLYDSFRWAISLLTRQEGV